MTEDHSTPPLDGGRAAATAQPVFLFGFERSGTTLLAMMVGAHPLVAIPVSTTGLWYRYAAMLDHYNRLLTDADLGRLVDDLLQEDRIRRWDVTLSCDAVLRDLPHGCFPAVVQRFHALYAQQHDKPSWGNVDIGTLDDMDQSARWFPHARFVHIVRDGRDVALSHRTYPWGASNTGECAEHWVRKLHLNLKMGALLGAERYHVLRYEDLVLDTEATLRRLCTFLSLPYDAAMLDYPRMVERKIPPDRRFLWPLIDQPPTAATVGRWKHAMRPLERTVFERTANHMLRQLGYEALDSVPGGLRVNALELWYFLGQGGRFGRLRRALRHALGVPQGDHAVHGAGSKEP